MKRIIVDYNKLTNEILTLLLEKFPDGYDDTDIIRFRNAKDELVEAVEVRTEDTIYLVKVSTKLANRMERFDDEDEDDEVVPMDTIKDMDMEDEDAPSDEEEDETDNDRPEFDEEDDEDEGKSSNEEDEEDEDE